MLYLINNISGEDRPVTVSYHGKSIPTQNLLQQNTYILKWTRKDNWLKSKILKKKLMPFYKEESKLRFLFCYLLTQV